MSIDQPTYNFSSGPACLPQPVLEQIKKDIPNWSEGMSVMEISHRNNAFLNLLEDTRTKLRQILNIPDDFEIMFMHGGARLQFSALGFNLFHSHPLTNFMITGHWSQAAFEEAKKYGEVDVVAHGESIQYKGIPELKELDEESTLLYYTDNETIQGVEFPAPPDIDISLISDMTSSILTKQVNFDWHALVFASAQKNLGIAGVTVVMVDPNFVEVSHSLTPSVLDYKIAIEKNSLYNTPPVFAIYVLNLVLQWAESQGGIAFFEEKAKRLSGLMYEFIDNSPFYNNPVQTEARSRINIPFSLPTSELEQQFLSEASQIGLMTLKGHRSVGGCRASIYNAMPDSGVEALVNFMKKFEQQHAK